MATIKIGKVQASNKSPRAWDVTLTVDGVAGQVTMVPSAHDGRPTAAGDSPDQWLSRSLLALPERWAEIEAEAAEAIEASGVDPSAEEE